MRDLTLNASAAMASHAPSAETAFAGDSQVSTLVRQLGNSNGVVRQRTRQDLIRLGSVAVSSLVSALESEQRHVSWEAAKALGEIGDLTAIPGLVAALNHSDGDVSWVAAQALGNFGRLALVPVLEGLQENAGFSHFRNGAHHVLHKLNPTHSDEQLNAILNAIDHPYPELSVPVAVDKLLRELRK